MSVNQFIASIKYVLLKTHPQFESSVFKNILTFVLRTCNINFSTLLNHF